MSYHEKKIIIVGAGELQIPLIQAAKNLGLTVIATDNNPQAIGFQYADDSIIADTMNPQDSLTKVKEYVTLHGEIHGVATSGTDASLTVATIAQYFNLPGHHPTAALNASNKALMRKCFEQANVPIPKYKIISSVEEGLYFFKELNSPCVVKPTHNMGARGVSLVHTDEELTAAIELALSNNRENSEILIEEFIDAHELSIDALINNGIITITGVADRIIEYQPYFVETGHILPSCLGKEWIERAVFTFRDGIQALGLLQGAAKADIKISRDSVWIIEIAARLSGGFMSSHTFPAATGIPLHEYMIKTALGEDISEITPTKNHISIERAIICPPGEIIDISIPENFLQQQYITHLSIRTKVGDIIHSPKNNLDKQGSVIVSAPTRELAIRTINKALKSIKITTKELRNSDSILTNSHKNARSLLRGVCNVCKYCDGIWCRGQIPGVGGVGTGEGFTQSYQRLREIKIIPNYIHDVRTPDTSINIFNKEFSVPIFVAPIGGGRINFNNSISELELQRAFLKGANQAGTLAFIPDPAPPEAFPAIAQAVLENYGNSILMCKPREDLELIKRRYKLCMEAGIIGLGTDIDGIGLKTLSSTKQNTTPKSIWELKELSQEYQIPFIIKGILSPQNAVQAIEAGATHIIVSSHGGRIGEAFPNPIDVLPSIKKEIGNQVPILLDGAIRSGADVVKAIVLGADAVLIGRPVAIHAVGGGYEAVTLYLKSIQEQLYTQMLLLGVSTIDELKGKTEEFILNKNTL